MNTIKKKQNIYKEPRAKTNYQGKRGIALLSENKFYGIFVINLISALEYFNFYHFSMKM